MTPPGASGPEAEAKVEIDAALEEAGWVVQNRGEMNLFAAQDVAVREFPLRPSGYAERMTRSDLDDFVHCYNPADRHSRKQTWSEKKNPEGRWRFFTYEELTARDKCSLDLFWLRDESLEDFASLPILISSPKRSPTTPAPPSARSRRASVTWKNGSPLREIDA